MSRVPDQLNILIIMTDQQRADTLEPSHPAPMPHLRAFLGGAAHHTASVYRITFRSRWADRKHMRLFSIYLPSVLSLMNNSASSMIR
jgi:arylsulfatase A-like enzyme